MIRPASAALSALLLLVALPGAASAAACCIGSVGASGARLGPCETIRLGGSWTLDALAGSWRQDGSLNPASSSGRVDQRFVAEGRFRVDDRFQVGFAMPIVLSARRVLDDAELGAGPGDLTLSLRLEPAVEPIAPAPQPAFGLDVLLPTGVPQHAAQGVTGAWATGAGHLAFTPSLWLGRTFGKGSFEVVGDATFSAPSPADGGRAIPGIAWSATALGGLFVHHSTTLSVSLGLRGRSPGWVGGKAAGTPSVEPRVGVGAAFKVGRDLRLLVGVAGSLPIPQLGRSSDATIGGTLGLAWLTRKPWSMLIEG